MTENEKLRALLAEAREWVGAEPQSGPQWRRINEICANIDAALAEPVGAYRGNRYRPYYDHNDGRVLMSIDDHGSWVHVTEAEELNRERDEARAGVERLRALLDTQSILLAEVGSRPAEQRVLELEMEIAVARTERDCAFQRGAEAMREAAARTYWQMAPAIRALPLPEEKP
jgi:hypothetical protein